MHDLAVLLAILGSLQQVRISSFSGLRPLQGKFYELFEMDAHVGAEVLGLMYMRVSFAGFQVQPDICLSYQHNRFSSKPCSSSLGKSPL